MPAGEMRDRKSLLAAVAPFGYQMLNLNDRSDEEHSEQDDAKNVGRNHDRPPVCGAQKKKAGAWSPGKEKETD